MGWIERGRQTLDGFSKKAKPKAEQLREEAPDRVQAAREKAERAGESLRSRFSDVADAFREGAHGEEPPKTDPVDPTKPPPPAAP